jgi:hypothetical protein
MREALPLSLSQMYTALFCDIVLIYIFKLIVRRHISSMLLHLPFERYLHPMSPI